MIEVPSWCSESTAQTHFNWVAPFYDPIMGWWEIPANLKALAHFQVSKQDAKILDLGCGTGLALCSMLKSLSINQRVTAVDSSLSMITRSRRRVNKSHFGESVDFVHGDAASLPMKSETFDACFSSFMLDMHAKEQRRKILRETWRVCKPGAHARWVVMDADPRSRWGKKTVKFYNRYYGHWNPIWMFFFPNYAPHCRPIDLTLDLQATGWQILSKEASYVTFFPVAIYHTQKC